MKLFSSAYNVWPADGADRLAFVQGLSQRDWVGGFELGYADSLAWPAGAPADLPAIVSGVPGTTGRNAEDADFGLASPDEAGRRRALEWARGEAAAVAGLVADGHDIRAVQVHSAPTGKADADAFAASLLELAGLDWGGAKLWVEHCDAFVEGQEPNKGYLTLDDEIAVLEKVSAQAPDAGWGLVINWARSAIEGRSAQTAQQHIETAKASGWLRHVGFSSCSGEATDFGGPWADQHLPLAGTSVAPAGTLLDAARVASAVAAAGEVTFGLKLAMRPKDMPGEQKLAALDENAAIVVAATAR
ncbi:DUF4862 family protein [Brooklawnia cerclae]|uniref:DUF4862 domain-containing protein n=1 Tax=Brooklawnia cerclae TaxID=349934 RepID=A0ABX0SK82_9ACTN|nr:DUF4862 family protein [Brooklawnia cerclae]NIH58775.1 hypothetical protein [Brooklawnia cerclae]